MESTLRDQESRLIHLAEEFQEKNHGQIFLMSANGKQISDYITQRKEDYIKAKEREREAAKVKILFLRKEKFQWNRSQAAHTTSSGTIVGRTPLKTKQPVGSTPSATNKRVRKLKNRCSAHLFAF